MNIKHLLLTLSLALSACAAPNISKDFSMDKATAAGVATGSITYDGGYAAYRLHLENKSTGEKFIIEHGSSQTLNFKLAFKGEAPHAGLGKKGSPFAVELPAGTYAIKQWHISQGAANVVSTAPTGIEFTIQPHEAIYLGAFHFHEASRLARAVTGSVVTLSDESARDLPVIRAQFAALASVPLTQSLSTGAKIENVGGPSDGKLTIPVFIPVKR